MCLRLYNQFFCSSLMLPEHREALAKHAEENEKNNTPCLIDEQQFEIWEQLLRQSSLEGMKITVKELFKGRVRSTSGIFAGFHAGAKLLKISTAAGEKRIKIEHIRSIE